MVEAGPVGTGRDVETLAMWCGFAALLVFDFFYWLMNRQGGICLLVVPPPEYYWLGRTVAICMAGVSALLLLRAAFRRRGLAERTKKEIGGHIALAGAFAATAAWICQTIPEGAMCYWWPFGPMV